ATLLVGRTDASLLPGLPLFAANIFRQDMDGNPVATAVGFVEALNWMSEQGVSVVNVSLSGPPNDLMEQAVRQATKRGMLIVAAVGNDHLAGTKRYPAAYDNVIGVTAIDSQGAVLPEANSGNYVSYAAPGVDIWVPNGLLAQADGKSADGAGDYYTGTSFAAPYVTAAAALVGNDVRRLQDGARDLGKPGYDETFGWGLVQAGGNCVTTVGQK
ncbi:MAG TPA: S8 family serine peptidase, partial [Dongiaceae bacterium]